jgi:cyclopropane-fatty-acyl-phospholipid synthase
MSARLSLDPLRALVSSSGAESVCRELLEVAGVPVDGSEPHAIVVHDRRFYRAVLADGALGLGESYMDGWWDCEALDEMIARVVRAQLRRHVVGSLRIASGALWAKLTNMQSVARAFDVGRKHYDIGNDLYEAMLDSRMVYTCGYWKNANTLEEAQVAKLDLVCRKTGLEPGMRVLELGCGWGSFAKYAAETYGVSVEGYTVSKEQVALGMERCRGLPVQLHLADYRQATGQYDAVISIGIMEHIGAKNYETYMKLAERCLRPQGVALVHTIGFHSRQAMIDPFYHRYVFPNAQLPSLAQLAEAAEDRFVVEDVHNFGPDYDPTLMSWWRNFDQAWPTLRGRAGYDARFYRMWRFYLLSCAGGFRGRTTQLFQLVLTRRGAPQPDCRLG